MGHTPAAKFADVSLQPVGAVALNQQCSFWSGGALDSDTVAAHPSPKSTKVSSLASFKHTGAEAQASFLASLHRRVVAGLKSSQPFDRPCQTYFLKPMEAVCASIRERGPRQPHHWCKSSF